MICMQMSSDMPANHIVEMRRKEPSSVSQPEATTVTAATHFSTGISIVSTCLWTCVLIIYTSLFTVSGSMIGNKKLNYGKLERKKQSVRCTIYSSYITHCQRIGYKQHCATDTQYVCQTFEATPTGPQRAMLNSITIVIIITNLYM